MVYAQILNGVIINTIVLDDTSLIPLFAKGFDTFIEIDQIPGSPGVGWTYNNGTFTPPVESD